MIVNKFLLIKTIIVLCISIIAYKISMNLELGTIALAWSWIAGATLVLGWYNGFDWMYEQNKENKRIKGKEVKKQWMKN